VPNAPISVPRGIVEALVASTDNSGTVQFDRDLEIGQKVRILSGPFADTLCRLAELNDRSRVRVLFEFMGAEVSPRLDRSLVAPADPSPRPVGVRDAKSIYSIGNKATRGYAIQTVAATTPGNRFLGRIYPHVRKSERVYRHFHIDEVRSSCADIGKARRLLGTPRRIV
jgi:hypothetical protein